MEVMSKILSIKTVAFGLLIVGTIWFASKDNQTKQPVAERVTNELVPQLPAGHKADGNVVHSDFEADINAGSHIQLCQGYSDCGCGGVSDCQSCGTVVQAAAMGSGFGYAAPAGQPAKMMPAINQFSNKGLLGREAKWRSASNLPFEQFAYGEYIGPHRLISRKTLRFRGWKFDQTVWFHFL